MDLTIFEKNLKEVRRLTNVNEEIAIHASLEDMFIEGLKAQPQLIVELGVSKEALANKILAMIAEMNDAEFWSCDLYDFSKVCSYPKWHFYQGYDLEFGGDWGKRINVDLPEIDLLFIDTDELYDHVRREITTFFPLLHPQATIMFRCTNLQKGLVYKDGSYTRRGWDNNRGVIRAINDTLKIEFDEKVEYEGDQQGFHIKHWPWGAGLTVMRKT